MVEETVLMGLVPELIAGIILTGFAWAFRSWSITLRSSSEKIISKLDCLAKDFHSHKLMVEHRVTSVEISYLELQKQVDRLTNITRLNQEFLNLPEIKED